MQSTAATVWTINHPFPKVPASIILLDESGKRIYGDIEVSSSTALAYYTHDQAVASATWTINHGFEAVPTSVVVVVDGKVSSFYTRTQQTTAPFTTTLEFAAPVAGKAYLMTGDGAAPLTVTFSAAKAGRAVLSIGNSKPPFILTQGSPVASLTVNHGLGRIPSIGVFNAADKEIFPEMRVQLTSPYSWTIELNPPLAVTVRVV
jgi:hypothetical protein